MLQQRRRELVTKLHFDPHASFDEPQEQRRLRYTTHFPHIPFTSFISMTVTSFLLSPIHLTQSRCASNKDVSFARCLLARVVLRSHLIPMATMP